jgi:hypothetical protein
VPLRGREQLLFISVGISESGGMLSGEMCKELAVAEIPCEDTLSANLTSIDFGMFIKSYILSIIDSLRIMVLMSTSAKRLHESYPTNCALMWQNLSSVGRRHVTATSASDCDNKKIEAGSACHRAPESQRLRHAAGQT